MYLFSAIAHMLHKEHKQDTKQITANALQSTEYFMKILGRRTAVIIEGLIMAVTCRSATARASKVPDEHITENAESFVFHQNSDN